MSKSQSSDEGEQEVLTLRRRGATERLEADGQTHRRDCECARCEAGFTPTEREREVAVRRAAEKQARIATARAAERRKEKARLAQLDLAAYFERENAAADAEVRRLRDLRAKVVADRRLEALLQLRRQGLELGQALEEIDRRLPPEGWDGAENDNGRPSGSARGGGPRKVSGELFS